jgi:hypothetical protein
VQPAKRPNNALLTDAYRSLRRAHGAAKRGRYAAPRTGHLIAASGFSSSEHSNRVGNDVDA